MALEELMRRQQEGRPLFNTIVGADWQRSLKTARESRNEAADQIATKMAASLQARGQSLPVKLREKLEAIEIAKRAIGSKVAQ